MRESSRNRNAKNRSKSSSKSRTVQSIKNRENQKKKLPNNKLHNKKIQDKPVINKPTSNKKLQNKYKRRRTFLVLIIAIIFIIVMVIINTHKANAANSLNYMNQGNNYVINNEYKKAIDSYQKALNLDSNNTKAKDLIGILQGYMKAKSCYDNGDINAANQALSSINPNYTRYPVGMQINGLKAQISAAMQNGGTSPGTSSEAKDDILTLNNLYSSGQYQKALDLIQKLNKENLNATQQVYVSEINNNIEQKLGTSSSSNNQFSTRGKYLNELDKINVQVNNMDLSAQTYEQKLQRAKNKYTVWNDELNKILQNIESNISGDKLTQLQTSQQAWVQQKNAQAVQSEAQYNNQLVKETANYQTQRSLTKDRCYYLVNTYM